MQLRLARHTERLADLVTFHRDGLGLTEIGANPYWDEHGVTFEDPDGFRVVLVPDRWDPSS
ncbi:MAG: hypothetical protein ACLQA5_17970 [Solirubrobacteraceae bacterium]